MGQGRGMAVGSIIEEGGGGSTVGLVCIGPALVSTEGAAICFYRGRRRPTGEACGSRNSHQA